VLALLDQKLKAQSGFGTLDLQHAKTAADVQNVMAAWGPARDGVLAGFNLGFDYLFMPLYGFSFYYGALMARDAFAPKAGLIRRLLTLLAAVPLAGGIFDAAENAIETYMVVNGATDPLAFYAFTATSAKLVCFVIGLVLMLIGVLGLFRKKAAPAGG
jgi:hypothetical protein